MNHLCVLSCKHVCSCTRDFLFPSTTLTRALNFNNFVEIMDDWNSEPARPFPQQPRKREGKWRVEEGKKACLLLSCTHPLLFKSISHGTQASLLELSMQTPGCVTGTGNLSAYRQSITLCSGVNTFIFYHSWWTIRVMKPQKMTEGWGDLKCSLTKDWFISPTRKIWGIRIHTLIWFDDFVDQIRGN